RLLREYQQPVAVQRLQALKKSLTKISERSSERERVALEAERESTKIKQVEWIAEHVGEMFDGLISGVTARGIFVEITPCLIEGFIAVENLEDDYYIFDEKTYRMVGRENNREYRLGDEVKIRVARVDRETNQVDFVMAANG
ncbi:MAG TPA: S1 RNA-binding domain-containing protein, partial [Caldithrix sp.]|nr:S1 RNA-binding domain-containing protein [Caldithrix sp.]